MADQTPPPPDNSEPSATPPPPSGSGMPPVAPPPGAPAPPPAYPGPAYPGPAPGMPAPYPTAPQNGMGTAALVMGILQFVCLGPIASILAIVFGAIGRSKAKQGLATNGGVATAGFWLGIAGLILSVIGAIIFAIVLALGINVASDTLDPVNNQQTGLADGSYSMDPDTYLHVNDRCSYIGTPTDVDSGQAATSRVTVVGEGAVQCAVTSPDMVEFVVSGGVAEITGVR